MMFWTLSSRLAAIASATSGLATSAGWEVRGRDGSGGGAAEPARRGGAGLEPGHYRGGGEKRLNKAEFDTSVEKCRILSDCV